MKINKIFIISLILLYLLNACDDKLISEYDRSSQSDLTIDHLIINSNNKSETIRPHYTFVPDFYYIGSANCFPPAQNCLAEIIVSPSKPTNLSPKTADNTSQNKFELFNNFEKYYDANQVELFFQQENWKALFTSMNNLFADEIIKKRIKLTRKTASMETNFVIFLIELNKNEKETNKTQEIIGAIQIELN